MRSWASLPTTGVTPTPRKSVSYAVCGAKIVVFGGTNGKEQFEDVFILNTGKAKIFI
jgi:hypothetical protein